MTRFRYYVEARLDPAEAWHTREELDAMPASHWLDEAEAAIVLAARIHDDGFAVRIHAMLGDLVHVLMLEAVRPC